MKKRESKKIYGLPLFVAIILVVSLFGSLDIEGQSTPSSWAEDDVQEASELFGISIEDMDYTQAMTRHEFSRWIVAMLETVTGTSMTRSLSNPFTDTDDINDLKAYGVGIVQGTSETTFDPQEEITRQEMAVMIVRALEYLENQGIIDTLPDESSVEDAYNDEAFLDDDMIASWSRSSVIMCAYLQIMEGDQDGNVMPQEEASNQEGLVLIMRLYNYIEEHVLEDDDLPFSFISTVNYITMNETTTHILRASSLTQGNLSDEATFVETEDLPEDITLTYSENMTQLSIQSVGVNQDEKKSFYIYVTNGETQISARVIVRIEDVKNYSPQIKENLDFQVQEGQQISIDVSDIATDTDGDQLTITSYERESGDYGSAVLSNSPTSSILTFTADEVEEDESQTYELTLTDGIVQKTATINIEIKNK